MSAMMRFSVFAFHHAVVIYRHPWGQDRVVVRYPLAGSSDARPRVPVTIPSLDDLARDPASLATLPRPVLLAVYAILAPLEAHVRAALLASTETPSARPDPDRAVLLDEACSLLGMSKDFVYRHSKALGAFKDADGRLKFSMRTIQRHLAKITPSTAYRTLTTPRPSPRAISPAVPDPQPSRLDPPDC